MNKVQFELLYLLITIHGTNERETLFLWSNRWFINKNVSQIKLILYLLSWLMHLSTHTKHIFINNCDGWMKSFPSFSFFKALILRISNCHFLSLSVQVLSTYLTELYMWLLCKWYWNSKGKPPLGSLSSHPFHFLFNYNNNYLCQFQVGYHKNSRPSLSLMKTLKRNSRKKKLTRIYCTELNLSMWCNFQQKLATEIY